MQRHWRIKDLLEWTTRYFTDKGIDESRLEAEILLAHVLKKSRVFLYANYEAPVNQKEREIYRGNIIRRAKGEPIAYITGHREFMSLDFIVSPDVLIPRPETELLVETAIEIVVEGGLKKICDIGTGSGAISVSLAYYLDDIKMFASDVSAAALSIARENAQRYERDISFFCGDLMEPFTMMENFDLITANLPYISPTQMKIIDKQVKEYEPIIALEAEDDGLALYRRLLPQAKKLMNTGAFILLEIDPGQVEKVGDLMQGFGDVEVLKDLAGRDRLIKARRV